MLKYILFAVLGYLSYGEMVQPFDNIEVYNDDINLIIADNIDLEINYDSVNYYLSTQNIEDTIFIDTNSTSNDTAGSNATDDEPASNNSTDNSEAKPSKSDHGDQVFEIDYEIFSFAVIIPAFAIATGV